MRMRFANASYSANESRRRLRAAVASFGGASSGLALRVETRGENWMTGLDDGLRYVRERQHEFLKLRERVFDLGLERLKGLRR